MRTAGPNASRLPHTPAVRPAGLCYIALVRAIFFGTPDFSVPCLEALSRIAEVALVVSQPDRPSGRGLAVTPPPVKARALELGLAVKQPTKVRTPDFAEELRAVGADVAVVVAYGRILPRAVLDAPRLGCVNVHASLLPRWRGAAPIQWAIASGDAESGVCLMQMDEGMDTGPVLARARAPIGPNETAAELAERLSRLGAELLERELPRFVAGELVATPQPADGVTLARILEKSDGRVDFTKGARAVHDHVRGMSPWPGAFATLAGARVKIHRTHVVTDEGVRGAPGTVLACAASGIEIACGRGSIAIDELQLEGRKRLGAAEHLAGSSWAPGTRFDEGAK